MTVDASQNIPSAVAALKNGDIIALPTETVYGLAADATNSTAVEHLFKLKHRPLDRALSLQVAAVDQIWQYAEKSEAAEKLADTFWPGPLTLVLPQLPGTGLSPLVNNNGNTLGFRIPDHTLTLQILKQVDIPLVVPSANLYGQQPATTVTQARDIFGQSVSVYVDGGACTLAEASTVLELTPEGLVLWREGTITKQQIQDILG